MNTVHPAQARKFADSVVRQLRDAGYQALFAGGCVRDSLLGREPKDYDVATDARPDQVQHIFGRRKTLSIGAAFGVITVIGSKQQGQIEVATFRCDAGYSDGRHPDHVTFSSAEEDAKRRDFTINGLFFDPLGNEVIDYVGGRQDLGDRVVRAIGDPHARFAEDKLRMLRAVRFTATLGFELEKRTLAAIQHHRKEIQIVSAERIATEMRRMLVHPRRRHALEWLEESGLLGVLLPEVADLGSRNQFAWQHTLAVLGHFSAATFPLAMASLFLFVGSRDSRSVTAEEVCRRWKLPNDDRKRTTWLLDHEPTIRLAASAPWSTIQPLLVHEGAEELLALAEAIAEANAESKEKEAIAFCRRQRTMPPEQLDPPPLLTGNDLVAAGHKPGPGFAEVLSKVRSAQLDGLIHSEREALAFARKIWRSAK